MADAGKPDVSLVIPVYNEQDNIQPLWEAVFPVLSNLGKSWEVVFIDDGSTDASLERLRAIARHDSRLRVIRLDRNRGQSAAFWSGFQAARGDAVVTMDADLQNDPQDIPLLLEALKDADTVIGWRHERRDTFVKRVASKIANSFRNWITKEDVHDVGCSLKAFRAHVIPHMFPFRGMHRFFPTLVKVAGFKVVEVKVRHHPRTRGKSKYGIFNRLFGPLADCFAVRWMKRRYVGRVEWKEIEHG